MIGESGQNGFSAVDYSILGQAPETLADHHRLHKYFRVDSHVMSRDKACSGILKGVVFMPTAIPRAQSHQNNLRQSAQHAVAGNQIHYERHRPEQTILYQLVQEHIETFFAHVELGLR